MRHLQCPVDRGPADAERARDRSLRGPGGVLGADGVEPLTLQGWRAAPDATARTCRGEPTEGAVDEDGALDLREGGEQRQEQDADAAVLASRGGVDRLGERPDTDAALPSSTRTTNCRTVRPSLLSSVTTLRSPARQSTGCGESDSESDPEGVAST